MKELFINQTGHSNKYWSIEQNENGYTVNWGKIGTKGRTITKELNNSLECETEISKLIKEKLNKGYFKVSNIEQIPNKTIPEYKPMNEKVFWEIISSFNWNKTGNDNAVLKPAVNKLISMTVEDIFKFADILSEKLYLLDGIKYASNIGEDSYKNETEHFSVDYFLYVRCCVVANGKDFYDQILKNPTKMPKEMDFEALLYLPEVAYNKKTKSEEYDYQPKFNFETFSNKNGWNPDKKPKKSKWKFW